MRPEQIEKITSAFPCFSSVPKEVWGRAEASILSVPAQPLMGEGHMFTHASFVLKGCVRIYKISPSGKELTLYRVKGGEICVIMMASILGETGYEAIAEAEEETEVLVLPISLFTRWMDTYKELRQFIYRLFVRRMVSVTSMVEEMSFHSMEHRVASLLLRKAAGRLDGPLYVTHASLAEELGTAREVVSRVLKKFEQLGWVRLGRGKMYILDQAGLRMKLEVK
ncbi:Crp/Fnr family transcriptional regulator [Brevibacillus ruminantium]|uniref:Crp/Fnr family transcriptional regulator n=1 Tax=Brevibacillus ruminantium TaxID=2950604 RepID=A0ABY4WFM8_9BACL|nr:Crp/Fnr family transcriptional regulator [Brevibacillus ruminantium]USG64817.1 Crp/Fnr family transcriptional regulator [Brevibacillus ruminantium]